MPLRWWTTAAAVWVALAASGLGACILHDGERRRAECRLDGDCPPDCWCDRGRCVLGSRPGGGGGGGGGDDRVDPVCVADGDCRWGWSCRSGRCQPTERFCGADRECWAGEVCEAWICRPACSGDSDCPAGGACRPDGHCGPAPVACDDLWDCEPGELCEGGACAPAETTCSSDWGCGPGRVCLNEACVPERPCEGDDDCPEGLLCADVRACVRPPGDPAPEACDFDYECPAGLRCEEDGRCLDDNGAIPCADGADCPEAGSCLEGRCQPLDPLACFSRLDCEVDEVCVDGLCQEAAPPPDGPGGGGSGEDGSGDDADPPVLGGGLCTPGRACGGIEYCTDTCFSADCCLIVCSCDRHDDRLYCSLYCWR
jgi:hypothetical protein